MDDSYEEMILKKFKFLEEDYGFMFNSDQNLYWRDNLYILITFDPPIPVIEFWFPTEPEFTKLNFLWFLQAFEKSNKLRVDQERYVDRSIIYYSNLLETALIDMLPTIRSLLVPALKLFIQQSMVDFKLSLGKLLAIQGFRLKFDYVKLKDPDWVPQINPSEINYT